MSKLAKKTNDSQVKSKSVASPKKGVVPQNLTTPTIHDSVVLDDNLKGMIKFIGSIKGKEGIFYGIELSELKGKNDGSVDGVAYFKCGAKKGLFVNRKKIVQITPSLASKNYPRLTVGDIVKVPSKKCNGIIKYIGEPEFKEGVWYGVELDELNGKNNGTIMNHYYFECENNKGTFLKNKEIIPLSNNNNNNNNKITSPKKSNDVKTNKKDEKKVEKEKEKEKEIEKEKDIDIKLGDKILIKPSKKGQIKYIGEAKNLGVGIWIGVRLTEKRGTCNGEYKGHKFFTCPDGYGIYIRKHEIINQLNNNDEDLKWDYMNEEKEINELKEDNLLSIKQHKNYLSQIKDKFRSLDLDGNQTIDLQEWNKIALDLNITQITPNNLQQIFHQIDTSKSNSISFAEFEKWYIDLFPLDNDNSNSNPNPNHDEEKEQEPQNVNVNESQHEPEPEPQIDAEIKANAQPEIEIEIKDEIDNQQKSIIEEIHEPNNLPI